MSGKTTHNAKYTVTDMGEEDGEHKVGEFRVGGGGEGGAGKQGNSMEESEDLGGTDGG